MQSLLLNSQYALNSNFTLLPADWRQRFQRKITITSQLSVAILTYYPSEHTTSVQRLPNVIQKSLTFGQRLVDVVTTSRREFTRIAIASQLVIAINTQKIKSPKSFTALIRMRYFCYGFS